MTANLREWRHGSPPQVRGKRFQAEKQPQGSRITPAGAGKTCFEHFSCECHEDHPRRCGENVHPELFAVNFQGSPPQVRGKLRGLNPSLCAFPDHPRRCGENGGFVSEARASQGSPPQVRGKRRPEQGFTDLVGITPAGAGKTLLSRVNFRRFRDHPRRCGENLDGEEVGIDEKGSPPQVRGKRFLLSAGTAVIGITPAGAGKTQSFSCPLASVQDHPRRCGENFIVLLAEQAEMGSPPQVRGKHCFNLVRDVQPGITPAGAGKTRLQPSKTHSLQDHPRRCGENLRT